MHWDVDRDFIADGSVLATSEHPFLVRGQGWVAAQDLRVEMPLATDFGGSAVILEATMLREKTTTYNLDVDGPDTFIVASIGGCGVLVHNRENDTYPYNRGEMEGIPRGKSFRVEKIGDHWVEQTWLPKASNPQHHFFWDAWLRANFAPDYKKRRDPFPCIELSYLDHAKLEDAGRQWFADNLGFRTTSGNPRYPENDEWKTVTVRQMRAAAKHAAASIGIPDKTIHTLSNRSLAYLRQHYVTYGCNLRNLLHP